MTESQVGSHHLHHNLLIHDSFNLVFFFSLVLSVEGFQYTMYSINPIQSRWLYDSVSHGSHANKLNVLVGEP